MTDKERREALGDDSNWSLSLRFPISEAFRVMSFEYYGLYIYRLEQWDLITFDWKTRQTCEMPGPD